MKKLLATLTVLLALGVATVAHASVTSNYNPDTRYNRYGYNNGTEGRVINRSTSGAFLTYFDNYRVYNFDEYGNQLPEESTDFKSLEFLGEFSINSWTSYRFWK